MPLTDLQLRVARVMAGIVTETGLVLAGGGALVALGLSDRVTRDLDFFATSADDVEKARPIVDQALRDAGLVIDVERSVDGFVRYVVSDDDASLVLELAYDVRLRAPKSTRLGSVLDPDELAADKMLALFGRAEARDFVDVFRLRRKYSREQLCALAAEKDTGFDRPTFKGALLSMIRHDRHEFDVDEEELRALNLEFRSWIEALTD